MKRKIDKSFTDSLAKKHVCYVLITCNAPSDDGKMEVEMTYEGDATLAAFLVQGAQNYIDEQECEGEEFACHQSKIHHIE